MSPAPAEKRLADMIAAAGPKPGVEPRNLSRNLWKTADCLLDSLAQNVGNGARANLARDDGEALIERAAILEFDGGFSRVDADRLAHEIIELGPNPSSQSIAALDARLRSMDQQNLSRRKVHDK